MKLEIPTHNKVSARSIDLEILIGLMSTKRVELEILDEYSEYQEQNKTIYSSA